MKDSAVAGAGEVDEDDDDDISTIRRMKGKGAPLIEEHELDRYLNFQEAVAHVITSSTQET